MASSRYVCQSCGGVHSRWVGRCEACGEWNTISEELAAESAPLGGKKRPTRRRAQKSKVLELVSLEGKSPAPPRKVTGISELDRTCGGGLVDGTAVLIGGDPGWEIYFAIAGSRRAERKSALRILFRRGSS